MTRLLRPFGDRNDRRGFTLIELVMMTVIGGILLTLLSLATQTQMRTVIDNRDYLVALNLAKRQMALMNNATYPAVAAEAAQTADAAFPNFIPTQEVVSVATSGGNSLREIRIRIRKGSVSGPVLVALYTYRSNILTFGNGV